MASIVLDIRELAKSKDMVPPSSKGNKSPSIKEKDSELPLMPSALKKQGSEIDMNRGSMIDEVGREGLSDVGVFWRRSEGWERTWERVGRRAVLAEGIGCAEALRQKYTGLFEHLKDAVIKE